MEDRKPETGNREADERKERAGALFTGPGQVTATQPVCARSIWLPRRNVCDRRVGLVVRAALLWALLVAPALAANEASGADEAVIPKGQEEAATPAANEPSAADEVVIPSGQEALLAEMLGKGATLPEQCKLAGGEVKYSVIKATYACPGGEVVFELRHPSKAPANATQTARFAITLLSGSPPAGFADALASRIRSHETAFEWKLPNPPARRFSRPLVLLAAAGLLGIVVLGWAVRRRRSARPTQLP